MLEKLTKYLFVLILSLSAAVATSQDAEFRKFSNEFLNIGIGARALGMSNSAFASSNDVTAAYWNPAGLSQINDRVQGSVMHAEYFAGIANFDYAGVAFRLKDSGTVGISVIRFGVDDIQNTIDLIDQNGDVNYDRITKFSTADYAVLFSFAKPTRISGLSVGGNAKIIRRIIGDFANSWGFGIDVGAHYKFLDGWQAGATLRDATTTFNAWNYTLNDRTKEVFLATDNEVPSNNLELTAPQLGFGLAKRFVIKSDFGVQPELAGVATFDGQRNLLIQSRSFNLDPSFGLEADFKNIIYLRGGIGNFATVGASNDITYQPNFGVGLNLQNLFGIGSLAIDYALTDIGDQSTSLYSNIFSLRFILHRI